MPFTILLPHLPNSPIFYVIDYKYSRLSIFHYFLLEPLLDISLLFILTVFLRTVSHTKAHTNFWGVGQGMQSREKILKYSIYIDIEQSRGDCKNLHNLI